MNVVEIPWAAPTMKGSLDRGVYVSEDSGYTWSPLPGPYDPRIEDVVFLPHINRIFLATYGDGVWRGDDMNLGLKPGASLPEQYALHPSHPNPFNPATTIRYDLPEAANVSLIVYDLLGQEVARLVNSYEQPGSYSVHWSGRDQHGRSVPSGIYLARLTTPEYSKAIKMVLLK